MLDQMLDQYQHRPDYPSLTTMLCSTPQCQTHSTQEAPPFFVSPFQLSLSPPLLLHFVSPFQLPSSPSLLLPLVAFDASPFVPTVPTFIHLFHLTFLDSGGTAPLPFVELTSFQLFCLIVSPNFHFVSTLSSSLSFYTGIKSSDVMSQRN